MKAKSMWKIVAPAVIASLLAVGCSKKSSDFSEAADADVPEVADSNMTAEIDNMAEAILQSADKMEAADWLTQHPTSHMGGDANGQPIRLAPIVSRLRDAGAQRIVINTAKIGQREFPAGMVIVLPSDAGPRRKVFKMDAQLSQACQQPPVIDRGQKYLHYGFD